LLEITQQECTKRSSTNVSAIILLLLLIDLKCSLRFDKISYCKS